MLASPIENCDLPAVDDVRLVRECVDDGSSSAWRILHRKYYPTVYAFLRRLGVSHQDLDDAVQEVFFSMFRGLRRYRGDAELSTWLYRLCLTAASRGHRRRRAFALLRELLFKYQEPTSSQELDASADTEQRMVEQALNRLNPKDRAAFVLFELEGLSGREIATILKCPESTVWRRLHYARRSLISQLREGATYA